MVYITLCLYLCLAAIALRINNFKTKFIFEGQNSKFFGFNDLKFKRKIFLLCFFSAASLIMGFRGLTVGTDTAEYCEIYFYITQKSWTQIFSSYGVFTQFEIGYAILMKLSSCICDNYFYFQFLVSVLYCLGMACFFYSDTNDILCKLIVFLGIGVYFRAFNITRQAFAVMLLVNSWKALKNQKKKPFLS